MLLNCMKVKMSGHLFQYSALFFCLCLIISSCKEEASMVPESDMDIHIQRLDKIVFEVPQTDIIKRFPEFSSIYFSSIVNRPESELAPNQNSLDAFQSDVFIQELKSKTDSIYTDLTDIKKELAASFDLFAQATGDTEVPNLYTFIGGLSYQCFLFDDGGTEGLGIGLDMFLGDAFPYQQLSTGNPAFSSYISRSFNRDHLSKKVMETIVEDRIGRAPGNRMLDYMIHNGKVSYILEQILPFISDTIIMDYSQDQLDWCEQNQTEIWSHFLRENLFYETDFRKINKLINPSPNSPGMPDQAPGRTANFIGWKIVKEFMLRNPQISMNDLILWSDYQSLLEKSKYKPR